MVTFLQDSFTDADGTPLASHLPEEGQGWEALASEVAGGPPDVPTIIFENQVHIQGSGNDRGATHRNATDPGDDRYEVSARFSNRDPSQFNRFSWLCWRMTPTGTAFADVDHYFVLVDNQSAPGELSAFKVVGGVLTQLAEEPAGLQGNVVTVRVDTAPGDTTVFVDDVPLILLADAEITQRGRVGLGVSRATQDDEEQWADDLLAANFLVPPEPPEPSTTGRPIQAFATPRPVRDRALARPQRAVAAARPIRPTFTPGETS